MKKTAITFLISGLLFAGGIKAQTIQEGMDNLYAGRYKSAFAVFDKLLSVNPTNIDAIYWKGQTYLETDEIMASRIAAARDVYEKGIQATNGAPLLQVGLGQVELMEGKNNEARQHFETALTLTRGKKGDDPAIETAIGRAINASKAGDFEYGVRLLEDATNKDPKNTETLLQLGNAYRKAGKGNGGGPAYTTYLKALSVNPNFAIASFRLAQLFQSQNNQELVSQYLNDAITKDPRFANAYYELFYYYFYRLKYDDAEAQLKKYIDSKLPESDIGDQYLYAQLCWARKDFDCAIVKAEGVIAALGEGTRPKVYRLLADAYYQKGEGLAKKGDSITARSNYANAKKFSDKFFAKKNPEDVILPDYEIKALIQAKLGATPDETLATYMQGVTLDTTVDAKLGYLKKGAAYFKDNKYRDKEAIVMAKIVELKPKPTINDYFDLTLAYYFSGAYDKSRATALEMKDKFNDQVYGYLWAFNSATAVDTIKQDSIAVPDALALYDFAQKDTSKYRSQYISAVRYLAAYYINKAKDKDKSLDYFRKWQAIDTANAQMIQSYIDQIEKMPAPKPGSRPATTTPKGTGKTSSPPGKTTTGKTKTKKNSSAGSVALR